MNAARRWNARSQRPEVIIGLDVWLQGMRAAASAGRVVS